MKYAWIENNIVRDTCIGNPVDLFVAEIAAFYDTEISDTTLSGAELIDGVWINRVPVEPVPVEPVPVEVVYPTVSVIEYKMLFTSMERIAIKSSVDPIVIDVYELLNDPRVVTINLNLKSIQDALTYFVTAKLLTAARVAVILKGVVT